MAKLRFYRGRNFYLLMLLITYFIVNASLSDIVFHRYLISAALAFTVLLCINIIARSKFVALLTAPLAMMACAGYLYIYLYEPISLIYSIHFFINGSLLILLTLVLIRSVAIQEEITMNTLFGAICGYMLIGLTWSYFYLAIAHSSPNSFNPMPDYGTFRLNLDFFMYFSYSTLTSLGYGDIVPVSHLARTIAWLEAITGQIYLAVWISQLVAIRIAQRIKKNKI